MDISLSAAEIALIGALLGAVTAPLTMLFRMLIAEKDRQIARLEGQLDRAVGAAVSGKGLANRAIRQAEGLRDERVE